MLIHGDCRAVLPTLEPASFDACITDPPYGDTSLTWDRQVTGWIKGVSHALKPNACIWVFGSMRSLVGVFAEMEAAGFKYAQDIVWEKQNGSGFHNDRFRRVHEHVVQFYRGRWRELFRAPQMTNDARAKTVRRKKRPAHTGNIEAMAYTSVDGGPRLQRSVIRVANMHGRAIHPTEKPVELLVPLVRYSVPPGGRVIDPFAGSASTLVACDMAGVTGVGIERKAEYYVRANERLERGWPLLSVGPTPASKTEGGSEV
ncbi:DNA-methyltransferase [Pigmentiphaga daeguensis]|uniref:Methyltransferase n=1 Tax=Pigmentiphaga daeguensis TaxID=414049 RepID=A0ABN1D0V2_9BURK